MKLLLACLLPLAALLVPRFGHDVEVLDACVGQGGEVFLVEAVQPLRLEVRAAAGGGPAHVLELQHADPRARVVDARLLTWDARGRTNDPILVVAIAHGERHSYYYVDRDPDGNTRSGEPIFTSAGEPFRIAGFENPGGDTIYVSFRRGYVGERGPLERMEERLYVNVCPPIHAAGRLVDVRSGEELELGLVEEAR